MDDDEKLAELLDLTRCFGIEVRLTPAAGLSSEHSAGALVLLKGREILIMDPTAPVADRVTLAAGALSGRAEIENCFIKPAIRCLLGSPAAPGGASDAYLGPRAESMWLKTKGGS